MDSFKTILNKAEGSFKNKKSHFIGILFPIHEENEIKTLLNQLKTEYSGANHYCYAYRIMNNDHNIKEYWSDDGEPSNSAGIQIYYEIKKHSLVNVLAVVVRYFGGIKLGVPGLIEAYKSATHLAIENATIIDFVISKKIKIECDYAVFSRILSYAKKNNISVLNQYQYEVCRATFLVPLNKYDMFKSELQLLNVLLDGE